MLIIFFFSDQNIHQDKVYTQLVIQMFTYILCLNKLLFLISIFTLEMSHYFPFFLVILSIVNNFLLFEMYILIEKR